MYTKFRAAYYLLEENELAEPMLDRLAFKELAPLIVIDCSHQNDSIRSSPVDIRVEFETDENIPANTSLYALLLHDRIVTYKPLSGEVTIKQT